MKKKTIRAKIASLLSASMALAMLAPAMPAQAANPKLIFDFKTQNKSVENILDDWEFSGAKGSMFKNAMPPGWTSNSSNIIGLPYWNSSDISGSVNGFAALVNTNSKGWEAEEDAPLNGMGLKGYKIVGWKSAFGDNVNRVEQPYFQENPVIYYATLGSDGNNVASYWVKREGKDGKYIPLEDSGATAFKAGTPIFVDPEIPTGYKLLNIDRDNDGDTDSYGNHGKTVEIFKSQTPAPFNPHQLPTGSLYSKSSNVAINVDPLTKKVSGNTHNRDMVIHYKYDVDETQKFNVNVWDVFFDGYGNEISRTKRTTISRNVLGDLKGTMVTITDTSTSPATVNAVSTGEIFNPAASDNIVHINATTTVTKTAANVGFDGRMVDPVGSLPARYVKNGSPGDGVKYFYQGETPTFDTPLTVVFSKDKSTVAGAAEGDFKPKNMVDANRDTNTLPATAENKTFNIDSDFSIHGRMINQKVDIYYNYKVNPAYYRNISVQYTDENGTNITEKVVAAASDSSYTGPTIANSYDSSQPTKLYKNGNELILKVDSTLGTSHVNIPIPKLKGYKFGSASDVSIEPTEMSKWNTNYSPANPTVTMVSGNAYALAEVWQTGTANESVVLRVMYNMDPAQLVKINPEPGMGGDIVVTDNAGNVHSYDTASHVEHQKYVDRQISSNPGMTKVIIKADDLPDPVPNVGYLFDKWVYDEGGSGISFMPSDLPKEFEIPTGAVGSALSMKFKAVFKKDPLRYNTYNLESGDTYTSFIGEQHPEILNVDNSGNPVDVHFSDLATYTDVGLGIVINSNPHSSYNVVWYDSSNNVVLKLDSLGAVLEQNNRAIISGETFKVYLESGTVSGTYDPKAYIQPGKSLETLNPVTGEPQIRIDPLNPVPMSPAIDYVVTDDFGNVLEIISGTDLVSRGGVISNIGSNNFLSPGNKYKVYTALRNAGVTVGSQIPGSGVCANPLEITIPVAIKPLVTADTVNQGKASVKISPTANNTEYALADSMGNIVYQFTLPGTEDNGTLTFNNLEPDTVYTLVSRPIGSGSSVSQRISMGAKMDVNTSNLGLSIDEFKVDVYTDYPQSPVVQLVKIDGNNASLNDLNSVKKGRVVEIVAPLIDAKGNNYYTWRNVSPIGMNITQGIGGTPSLSANSRIVFTMPGAPVKLQIMYDAGIIWDTDHWIGNNISNKNIGVTVPDLASAGATQMRITIKKDIVPENIKKMVAETLFEEYKPEYMFSISVEKKDALNNWVEYNDAAGELMLSDVRINTGALDFSKNYMLHELATSSNAVALLNENIGRLSANTSDPSYTGEFSQDLYAKRVYVFGYSKPVYHNVKIMDNRKNTLVANFTLAESDVVKDYEFTYIGSISKDYIDDEGVKWHYEGLSTDKEIYKEYDPSTRVRDDITLYIFYSNDSEQRLEAEQKLKAAIEAAVRDLRNYDAISQTSLQSEIDSALAVLNRVNRKSSARELQDALDKLNALIPTLKRKSSGGSSGGSGGSGNLGGGNNSGGGNVNKGNSSGKSSNTSTNNTIRVGYDGNWELLNTEEAASNPASGKWIFKMANGTRITGWAYLSYTYQNITKNAWYHFEQDNIMDSGWLNVGGNWYYLSTDHNGFFGEMKTGWYLDGNDNRWYYLDSSTGAMATGWIKLGNEYYYLNKDAVAQTWFFDSNTKKWQFKDGNSKPFGAMYQNERTPDGYNVDQRGVWY